MVLGSGARADRPHPAAACASGRGSPTPRRPTRWRAPALDPGRLVRYVGTSPETVARAERAVSEELDALPRRRADGRARSTTPAYLLGREPFRRETARQWADLLGLGALSGLPFDDPAWSTAEIPRR